MRDPQRERLLKLAALGDRDAALELIHLALRRDDLETCGAVFEALGQRRAVDRLLRLRALTREAPQAGVWRSLCELLERWPAGEGQALAVEHAQRALDGWPDGLRKATWRQWRQRARGRARHLWPLVRRLELDGPQCNIVEIERLAAAPELGALTELVIEAARCGDVGAARLAGARNMPSLRRLDLALCGLGPEGVAALAASAAWPGLEGLGLASNAIGDAGAAALAGAWRHARALDLNLNHAGLSDRGAEALAASATLRPRGLDLSCNAIGDAGAAALLMAPWAEGLESLGLASNRLGDGAMLALVRSGRLGQLRALDLRDNQLSARGVATLARASLPSLTRLDLGANRLSEAAVALLCRAPGLRALVRITLDGRILAGPGAPQAEEMGGGALQRALSAVSGRGAASS